MLYWMVEGKMVVEVVVILEMIECNVNFYICNVIIKFNVVNKMYVVVKVVLMGLILVMV